MYQSQLSALIDRAQDDWGNREEKKANLIYYGINYLDQAFYGIDLDRGEMIGIQAQEKHRKSTTVFNIVFNIAYQFIKRGSWLCFDTLESGMPPTAVRDYLIAMSASRLLIAKHYNSNDRSKWPSVKEIRANTELASQLTISKEFLWYGKWSTEQTAAIEQAKSSLRTFPINIFGPSKDEGMARELDHSIKRWHMLYHGDWPECKGQNHRVFVTDNLQLYYGFGSDKFGQLEQVVAAHANFLVTHPGTVVIDVSQVSKGAVINSKLGGVELYAKGGGALAAEVNVLIETEYDKDNYADRVIIRVPRTRKRPPPDVYQELDRESGAFLRPAYPVIGA